MKYIEADAMRRQALVKKQKEKKADATKPVAKDTNKTRRTMVKPTIAKKSK